MFATAWLWLFEWAASKTKVFWIDLGVLSLTFVLGGCAGCACEKHRPHIIIKESAEPPLAPIRPALIALLNAGNGRECCLRLDADRETTVSLVFGGSKYTGPDGVLVYTKKPYGAGVMKAEDAADKFIRAYDLDKTQPPLAK